MASLYAETSLVLGIAMGHDADALSLLFAFPPVHGLILPAVCLMESFSAYQRKRSDHNEFVNGLQRQAKQAKRDTSSPAAGRLRATLQQAVVDSTLRQNDIESRLVLALTELTSRARIVPVEVGVYSAALATQHMRQFTDNLILHTILADAAAPGHVGPKALLTSNTKDFDDPQIRSLLTAAGVTEVWPTSADAKAWLAAVR